MEWWCFIFFFYFYFIFCFFLSLFICKTFYETLLFRFIFILRKFTLTHVNQQIYLTVYNIILKYWFHPNGIWLYCLVIWKDSFFFGNFNPKSVRLGPVFVCSYLNRHMLFILNWNENNDRFISVSSFLSISRPVIVY